MFERVTELRPLALLCDRSRDAVGPETLPQRLPGGIFLVTDNRRRLTARMLAAYDMVTICASGTVPYSRAERSALRGFVREGGTLVLAASAGEFELAAELPASRLAVNGVARVFGFSFPGADGLPADLDAVRRVPARNLELTAAGRRVGLTLGETFLSHPAPIEAPKRAVVLLRVRRTGAPVAARLAVGRGTVLVWGDLALFLNGWTSFGTSLHLATVAPRRRRPAARPPVVLDVPRETLVDGDLHVRFSPFARSRANRVLELARVIPGEIRREIHRLKRPRRTVLLLEPGSRWEWFRDRDGIRRMTLGADAGDAAVALALLGGHVYSTLRPWFDDRRFFPYVEAARHHVTIRVLERLGLDGAARIREAAARGGRAVDLATVYSQKSPLPRPMIRFFADAERALGPGTFRAFFRSLPAEKPFRDLPGRAFSALDAVAFHLARAVGTRAYEWLESGGHTVRRVPLAEPGSDALRRGVERILRARLPDGTIPASARVDAVYAMAESLAGKAGPHLSRQARAKEAGRALPAALALARRGDRRGLPALRRWRAADNAPLADIAALLCVAEGGDADAASRLVRAAGRGDTRFRLAAGRALAAIGDPRAERFSFARLPECGIRRIENGILRLYPTIDGREVSLTSTGPLWWARGYGAATSRYYVYWVHTRESCRRLGLARVALERAFRHRLARRCSETALHAMRSYHAHALYRELGLFDSREYRSFTKPPEASRRRAPRGVRIRPARPGDALAAAALANHLHRMRDQPVTRLADWPGGEAAFVAEEGGNLLGMVSFAGGELRHFAVDETGKPPRRTAVGLALLAAAERRLRRERVKSLSSHSWFPYEDGFHQRILHRAGWGSGLDDLVEQGRIRDLVQYLRELRPALEGRLREVPALAGFSGWIALRGDRLRAAVGVDRGRVAVRDRPPAGPAIRLEGEEQTIQRIVLGVATPFDEYIQTRLAIRPRLTAASRKLLETLFPRTWVT